MKASRRLGRFLLLISLLAADGRRSNVSMRKLVCAGLTGGDNGRTFNWTTPGAPMHSTRSANRTALVHWWDDLRLERAGFASRPVHVIRALVQLGFEVDLWLAHWSPSAAQPSPSKDVRASGARYVYVTERGMLAGGRGPSPSTKWIVPEAYAVVVYFNFPPVERHSHIFGALCAFVRHKPTMRIVAVADDESSAMRKLGTLIPETTHEQRLAWARASAPKWMGGQTTRGRGGGDGGGRRGIVATQPPAMPRLNGSDARRLTWLLALELKAYVLSDVVLGITPACVAVVRSVLPATRVGLLPYYQQLRSPAATAALAPARRPRLDPAESHFVYVGMKNLPNRQAVGWVLGKVLPALPPTFRFHIVGRVASVVPCGEDKLQQVTCYPGVNDAVLDALMRGCAASINPAVVPTGIGTKSVRSLANGVPIVTSTNDGTVAVAPPPREAVHVCAPFDAGCFVAGLRRFGNLAGGERLQAGRVARAFVDDAFSWRGFMRNLTQALVDVDVMTAAAGEQAAEQHDAGAHDTAGHRGITLMPGNGSTYY